MRAKMPKSKATQFIHKESRAKSARERLLRRNSRKQRLIEVLEHKFPYAGPSQRFRGHNR